MWDALPVIPPVPAIDLDEATENELRLHRALVRMMEALRAYRRIHMDDRQRYRDTYEWHQGVKANLDPYSLANVTTDRTMDADATSTDEVADVLGTLITDIDPNSVGVP